MHYVYITTNNVNNKKYIGQRRFDENKTTPEDDNYFGSGTLLVKAIKKYGSSNFSKEILCVCDNQKEVDEKEIYYIDKYQALYNRDEFYNRAEGGQYDRSENHSESMSKRMNHYYSHPELWSEKHRQHKWKITVNKIYNQVKRSIVRNKKKRTKLFNKTIDKIYKYVRKKENQAYMKTDEYKKYIHNKGVESGAKFKEKFDNDPVFRKEWYKKNNGNKSRYNKLKSNLLEANKDKSIIHKYLFENNLSIKDLFPDWSIYSYTKGRYKSNKYLVPFIKKVISKFKEKNIDVCFGDLYSWYVDKYGSFS
jgi:hypothetical protein